MTAKSKKTAKKVSTPEKEQDEQVFSASVEKVIQEEEVIDTHVVSEQTKEDGEEQVEIVEPKKEKSSKEETFCTKDFSELRKVLGQRNTVNGTIYVGIKK